MAESKASFSYCFTDGTLHIEGSELFVSQQVEAFRERILESLDGLDKPAVAVPQLTHVRSATDAPAESSGVNPESIEEAETSNPYPRVLDTIGDKLKITTSIKGRNTADKAINLILAYLWGKEALLDDGTADSNELRELCEEHACLDSSNFSSTLGSKKNLILADGAKGSRTKIFKLTYPGKEAAQEILKELNDAK